MARNYFESLTNTHKRMADIQNRSDTVTLRINNGTSVQTDEKKNDEFYFWLS